MKIPVFYYHSVGRTPLSVRPEAFRAQMAYAAAYGFRAITLSQLARGACDPGAKQMVVTFDDCFADVYEHAVPVLAEFGFTATFFAVTGYDGITLWGSSRSGRWNRRREGDFTIPFTFFDCEMRRRLIDMGMEIGAHTLSHRNLDELTKEEIDDEVAGSKTALERELGLPVTSFCYPRGRYDRCAIEAVRSAGYSSACTTRPGYFETGVDSFLIPRFGAGNDMRYFRAILDGRAFSPAVISYVKAAGFINLLRQTIPYGR